MKNCTNCGNNNNGECMRVKDSIDWSLGMIDGNLGERLTFDTNPLNQLLTGILWKMAKENKCPFWTQLSTKLSTEE